MTAELEYLKFFYKKACEQFEEGGTDERYWISEEYTEETGNGVPEGYGEQMTRYHVTTWATIDASSFDEAEQVADNIERAILNITEVVLVATIEIDGEQE